MKRFMYIIHIVSETIPTAEKKLLDLLFLGVISLQTTILGKIFAYFFTFYKTFPSSQLKRDQIIFTREWMYQKSCRGHFCRWAGLSVKGVIADGRVWAPTQEKKKNSGEKFGNIEKILDVLRIDGQYPAGLPKSKFWQLYYISCNTSCNIAKTQL